MSDSVWPHRRQPTRLPLPQDSPGKNTGVGCHFLLQCRKVKSESEVAQLYPTLSDPMDCSLPGSSIHGIFQARVLEWGARKYKIIKFWLPQMKQVERKCKFFFSVLDLKEIIPVERKWACLWINGLLLKQRQHQVRTGMKDPLCSGIPDSRYCLSYGCTGEVTF